MQGWYEKIAIFDQYLASKTIQDTAIVTMEGKWETVYPSFQFQ